ncbi:MAG TPA: hypothetical protein VKY81_06665 [Natronosporangium sp.]|nr:hypothetical protein [Natronosporangium sp.]
MPHPQPEAIVVSPPLLAGDGCGRIGAVVLTPAQRQVRERAKTRGLAVGVLSHHWLTPGDHPQAPVVRYAAPGDHVYPAAVDALARVLRSA